VRCVRVPPSCTLSHGIVLFLDSVVVFIHLEIWSPTDSLQILNIDQELIRDCQILIEIWNVKVKGCRCHGSHVLQDFVDAAYQYQTLFEFYDKCVVIG
jgi:hypothetical protein